jgi:hypothetical protein
MLGGLTDRQLLERFVNRNDSSAEDAFTILVDGAFIFSDAASIIRRSRM